MQQGFSGLVRSAGLAGRDLDRLVCHTRFQSMDVRQCQGMECSIRHKRLHAGKQDVQIELRHPLPHRTNELLPVFVACATTYHMQHLL